MPKSDAIIDKWFEDHWFAWILKLMTRMTHRIYLLLHVVPKNRSHAEVTSHLCSIVSIYFSDFDAGNSKVVIDSYGDSYDRVL